jgi:hypothetical protein
MAVLQKCFKSYCDIKNGKDYQDIPVDKTEFIIYTNRTLDPTLPHYVSMSGDIFFKTRDTKVLIITSGGNKQTDVYTLLKNAVRGHEKIYRPSDIKMIHGFLYSVKIVASVNGKCQLDAEIQKEIEEQDAIKVSRNVYKAELHYLKTWVASRLKNRKEGMTAEMFRNWLQEAKTKACVAFVKSLFVSCTKGLDTTGIHFADSEISRLQAELSNNPAVHLRSDAPALCSILLMHCLPVSKCIYVNLKSLLSDRGRLLHAWFGGEWQWCVVFCDSELRGIHISEMCLDMLSIMKSKASDKCLIILTPFSVKQIEGFSPIDHNFKFKQLPLKRQTAVLDKSVNFLGYLLTVKSILHRHGIVKNALRAVEGNSVSRLATEETGQLGGRLRTNRGYYYHCY